MGNYVVTKRTNGEFQFNLKAVNGEIILTSEGYTSKTNCLGGVDSVKRNAKDDSKYERKAAKNGKYYFTLKATNGQVVGTSEMYDTEASREVGITSVKSNAPEGAVVDQAQ